MCLHHHEPASSKVARREILNLLAAVGLGAASLPLVRQGRGNRLYELSRS